MLPFFFLVFCNQRLGRNMLMIKVKETLIYCKEFFFVVDYLEKKNLWGFFGGKMQRKVLFYIFLKGHADITTAYHDYVPFAYANQVRLSIRLIP